MGTDAQVWVPAHRPVLHVQDQLDSITLNDVVIGGTHQGELGMPACELVLELLNRSWRSQLLETSGGALARNRLLLSRGATQPARQGCHLKRGAEQEQQGQNPHQQRLQARARHG